MKKTKYEKLVVEFSLHVDVILTSPEDDEFKDDDTIPDWDLQSIDGKYNF